MKHLRHINSGGMIKSGKMAQYTYEGDIPSVGTVTVPEPLSVDDNGSTLSVDDGAGSLTVDGTVAVSGTVTTAESRLPSSLGQAVMASSVAVAIASNQTAIPITDNAGSITIDGSLTTVGTITNVVHVDDNSGSLTVDGSVSITGTAAVSMASPPTPPASIFSGKTTVTTAGSRVALASTQALKQGVLIRAATANTGLIYVGTAAGVSSSVGYELAPGEALYLSVADLASVGLDSSVNSQVVTYLAS